MNSRFEIGEKVNVSGEGVRFIARITNGAIWVVGMDEHGRPANDRMHKVNSAFVQSLVDRPSPPVKQPVTQTRMDAFAPLMGTGRRVRR